jgi:hypothetical protein
MSLKVNGEAHAETLQSRAKLAALLMRTGRYTKGEALARSVLERLDDRGARYSTGTAANVRSILAGADLEVGLPQKAEVATLADIDDLRSKMPGSGALASRILLISDRASIVPAKILRGGQPVISQGRGDGTIDLRPLEVGRKPVKGGDIVSTSSGWR